MAAQLRSLCNSTPLLSPPRSLHRPHRSRRLLTLKCTSDDSAPPDFPSPSPTSDATIAPDKFPIERRRRSEIVRDRRPRPSLSRPEPPNMEVGWRRTKVIDTSRPKGHAIADFLEKLEGLMGREFGSADLLAKAGEMVAGRAREEAEALREGGEVEERVVTELFRVLRLMEMDLAMVRAAVKEETLAERVEQARARCRQAILVANSF
ncbi:protein CHLORORESPIRATORY REDUCTION 41, chloroplastic [Syzygium oleosum]|uniref:protein CHLORORESPIRATORY REDUCTION 41, chloroplastic n=1 Tax=Syzygium oleosum TaxID=219896 RepID=UPI0024B96E5E|nr:protein CHLORORESPIRATORY REDUCTION 41, chloroplastic [Syzygium oleosum]